MPPVEQCCVPTYNTLLGRESSLVGKTCLSEKHTGHHASRAKVDVCAKDTDADHIIEEQEEEEECSKSGDASPGKRRMVSEACKLRSNKVSVSLLSLLRLCFTKLDIIHHRG